MILLLLTRAQTPKEGFFSCAVCKWRARRKKGEKASNIEFLMRFRMCQSRACPPACTHSIENSPPRIGKNGVNISCSTSFGVQKVKSHEPSIIQHGRGNIYFFRFLCRIPRHEFRVNDDFLTINVDFFLPPPSLPKYYNHSFL